MQLRHVSRVLQLVRSDPSVGGGRGELITCHFKADEIKGAGLSSWRRRGESLPAVKSPTQQKNLANEWRVAETQQSYRDLVLNLFTVFYLENPPRSCEAVKLCRLIKRFDLSLET